jgi:hypothetical protein
MPALPSQGEAGGEEASGFYSGHCEAHAFFTPSSDIREICTTESQRAPRIKGLRPLDPARGFSPLTPRVPPERDAICGASPAKAGLARKTGDHAFGVRARSRSDNSWRGFRGSAPDSVSSAPVVEIGRWSPPASEPQARAGMSGQVPGFRSQAPRSRPDRGI